jgi:hypothetical protein
MCMCVCTFGMLQLYCICLCICMTYSTSYSHNFGSRECNVSRALLCLLNAGFVLGLLFSPEDGGDIFLWNISWLSPGYTAVYTRRQTSCSHCCENFKSSSVLLQILWMAKELFDTDVRVMSSTAVSRFLLRSCISRALWLFKTIMNNSATFSSLYLFSAKYQMFLPTKCWCSNEHFSWALYSLFPHLSKVWSSCLSFHIFICVAFLVKEMF